MTFGEITAQFLALMNRTDLKNNPTLANTFLQQGIQRISRELRVPAMEKSVSATIGTSYNGLLIPGDLLELIDLEVFTASESHILRRSNLSRVKTLAFNTGVPEEFSRQGSKWYIGPRPAAGTQVRIDYYADFAPLVAPADTNVLTVFGPDAIIYAALESACDYYADTRNSAFGQRYQQIMLNLQNMADGDELTADAVVSPVYAWPSDR